MNRTRAPHPGNIEHQTLNLFSPSPPRSGGENFPIELAHCAPEPPGAQISPSPPRSGGEGRGEEVLRAQGETSFDVQCSMFDVRCSRVHGKGRGEVALRAQGESPFASPRVIRTFMVDDSPLMLVLLARVLAKDQRILIVGSTTDSQKAFCSASMSHPDLVLVDLHMPCIDGVEIMHWLKQLQNPPVVFVVTSDDTPQAKARCLRAGADAFLLKTPDLPNHLGEAIKNFFGNNAARLPPFVDGFMSNSQSSKAKPHRNRNRNGFSFSKTDDDTSTT